MGTAIAIRKPLRRHRLRLSAKLAVSNSRAIAERGDDRTPLSAPILFPFNFLRYGQSNASKFD